jgi:hypothetical protein
MYSKGMFYGLQNLHVWNSDVISGPLSDPPYIILPGFNLFESPLTPDLSSWLHLHFANKFLHLSLQVKLWMFLELVEPGEIPLPMYSLR